MAKDYDLVVIGSGSAARTVATTCAESGWRTSVCDDRPLGGTCVLRGCDPKKALISGIEPVEAARRMHGAGVAGELRVDWPALMRFKRSFTNGVPERQEQRYADLGIDVFPETAAFTGERSLHAGATELAARHVVIASGAEPVPLPIPGAEYLLDSSGFLELERLPRSLALVGGGYIAAEFAHIAARAGAEVSILQRDTRLLTGFDPDLVATLQRDFAQLGVRVHTDAAVTAIEREGGAYRIHTDGGPPSLAAEAVVHAAGRAPPLETLAPERAGIDLTSGMLALNEFLQSTSNPAVYAAGDAAGAGPPLTPVASHDGRVVAANLTGGNHARPDYRGVPSVVFTLPPLARAGLGEAEAEARGYRFRVNAGDSAEWYSSRRLREPVSGFKLLIEDGSEAILGAHLLGPHAAELINVFALAIRHGLTAPQLRDTLYAYPTGASDIAAML